MNNLKFSTTLTVQYPTPFSAFTPEQFGEGLQWVKESGFDAVELCISNYKDIDVNSLKDKINSFGLNISTISTGQARSLENISLLHEGDALKKAQERMLQHIEAASIFCSKVTLGLLRGLGSTNNAKSEKKQLAKNLEQIIEYASKKNVTIILECINRYETALFNDASSTVEFIKNDLGNPECIGILWDVFHANIEDPNFGEAIDEMGNKLKHVHIADSNRMFPGYGHTDFNALGKLLINSNFSEYLSFECFNKPSLDVILKDSSTFISNMKSL